MTLHLLVLRRGLDDICPTGGRFVIDGDQIEGKARGWTLGSDIPDELADPRRRRESADERMRDVAAMRLNGIVAALPFCHILQMDPDQKLPRTKEILDLYRGRFRSQSGQERKRIEMGFAEPGFIPNIKPLGRSATPADVKAGDAIFELNGKGRIADVELPAWLLLKSDAKKEYPRYGLVVQAEVGPDGKIVFGAVFRYDIRAVRADEVERIEPYRKQ